MTTDVNASFKAAMKSRKPVYGLFVGQAAPSVVEIIGYAGFDFCIVDMEHGPAGFETLENMIRAAEVSGIACMARVPNGTADEILRTLDAGAAGILVPHVKSAEIAQDIVSSAYYPPFGKRGISGVARGARYSFGGGVKYFETQGARTTVWVMIEDKEAIPHAGAISNMPGVDAVFVGPSDLSASLGHPGNTGHPEARAALDGLWKVLSKGQAGVATAVPTAEEAKRLAGEGVSAFCFNAVQVLAGGLKSLAAAVKA
jgi:4-hydroxy-2-oxoheptanedioate aldolase